jgi:hypothetical protein
MTGPESRRAPRNTERRTNLCRLSSRHTNNLKVSPDAFNQFFQRLHGELHRRIHRKREALLVAD